MIMKKKIITAVFIVVLISSLMLSNEILKVKSFDGIRQAESLYYQGKNMIDVAFLGSSHIHCDINTQLLFDDYGIAGYDYSAADQPLWITYYYLIELEKRQNPKLVVIDLYAPARIKEDYRYRWMRDNLYGVRFSLNKINMMNEAVEREELDVYFPSFWGYHNRFIEVGFDDFEYLKLTHKDKERFKGYTPYYGVAPQEEPVITTDKKAGLTAKSEAALRKIIQYAKENDINLFFVAAPYTETNEDRETFNEIAEILNENDIEFFNGNEYYKEMGINYSEDFHDYSHLNYEGGLKYTNYLAGVIKERFDIPDRRGDEKYSSWANQVFGSES